MCFHYSLTQKMAAVEAELRVVWDDAEWQPVYHADAFTFLKMPAITMEAPSKVQLFHWGLIPQWVKTSADADKLKAQTLNARSETVFEKPSFRNSINRKRCLIPADGFFEWMDHHGKKYPHYIYLQSQRIFCFAGIYADWTDKTTGELISTFSILTTEANPMMARIHNLKKRMPVILEPTSYEIWLDKDLSVEKMQFLMQPYVSADMQAHTISKLITSRRENSNVPAVTEAFSYPELQR